MNMLLDNFTSRTWASLNSLCISSSFCKLAICSSFCLNMTSISWTWRKKSVGIKANFCVYETFESRLVALMFSCSSCFWSWLCFPPSAHHRRRPSILTRSQSDSSCCQVGPIQHTWMHQKWFWSTLSSSNKVSKRCLTLSYWWKKFFFFYLFTSFSSHHYFHPPTWPWLTEFSPSWFVILPKYKNFHRDLEDFCC